MLLTITTLETFSSRPYVRGQVDLPLAKVTLAVSNAEGPIGEYPAVNAVGLWVAQVTDDLEVGDYDLEVTAKPLLGASQTAQAVLSVITDPDTEHLDIGNGPGTDTMHPMNPPPQASVMQTWEVGGRHPKCSTRVRMFRKPDR